MTSLDPSDLSPKDFERHVMGLLASEFSPMAADFEHLEVHDGSDGSFEIDITVRLRVRGSLDFLLLVECKRYTKPIEREIVQVLESKMRSLRAQKGMVVSTSAFRSGAIAFASHHRIALVQLQTGSMRYRTRSRPVEFWLHRASPGVVGVEASGQSSRIRLGNGPLRAYLSD